MLAPSLLTNLAEAPVAMGAPILVDSVVKTMLMLSYMIHLDRIPASPLARDHRIAADVPNGRCGTIKAVSSELYDMASMNCEALWRRFEAASNDAFATMRRDDWRVESKDHDMIVRKLYLPDYKRTAVMGETILNVSPEEALYIFWDIGIEIPRWNPEIAYVEDIVTVAPNLRISYQVSSSKMGGLVYPRDFLVVTGWLERDQNYYLTYTNVSDAYRPHPIKNNYVRGMNGPSLFAFERLPNEKERTRFKYMLNYDMRLSSSYLMPQAVINRATIAAMKDYLKVARQRANNGHRRTRSAGSSPSHYSFPVPG